MAGVVSNLWLEESLAYDWKNSGLWLEELWFMAGRTLVCGWRNFGLWLEELWFIAGGTLVFGWRNFGLWLEEYLTYGWRSLWLMTVGVSGLWLEEL